MVQPLLVPPAGPAGLPVAEPTTADPATADPTAVGTATVGTATDDLTSAPEGAATPAVDVASAESDDVADEPRRRGPLSGLSPSRASDFMTCPLLFRFRTIDRLPDPPGPAAARGTLVHRVLEQLFDRVVDERTPEVAASMLPAAWDELVAVEPELADLVDGEAEERETWFAAAAELLDRYFTLEDPRRIEPAERELYVETELEGGLRLRGYVDRLDVAANGQTRVVDYKTGRAPGEGFEARAMFQMRFYALVLWKLRGAVPDLLQLVYLGSGEVLRYAPDEADLSATERKVVAVWQAIEKAYAERDWRPSPSRLCDWCNHQAICPAFGGTPPALPDLEPVDESVRDLAAAG